MDHVRTSPASCPTHVTQSSPRPVSTQDHHVVTNNAQTATASNGVHVWCRQERTRRRSSLCSPQASAPSQPTRASPAWSLVLWRGQHTGQQMYQLTDGCTWCSQDQVRAHAVHMQRKCNALVHNKGWVHAKGCVAWTHGEWDVHA